MGVNRNKIYFKQSFSIAGHLSLPRCSRNLKLGSVLQRDPNMDPKSLNQYMKDGDREFLEASPFNRFWSHGENVDEGDTSDWKQKHLNAKVLKEEAILWVHRHR